MASKGMKPILYSYWRSSCSWRIRSALNFKNIEYEYKEVNLVKDGGQQKTEEYKSVNPAGVVPSLIIDSHQLTESLAILEYLEETHPDPPLLPRDPHDRARVRALCLQVAAGIQPIQNLGVLTYVGEQKGEWGRHWITKGLETLEKMLKETAGKYSFGDSVTIADMCLVPQIYNANRFKVDMSSFPTIQRVNEAALEVDAIKRAHPGRQPDCPESDRIQE